MSDLLNQASLVYIPSGYKEDTAYSVIPTDGSGDLTFSRASDGTRVNSQGLVERVPWNLCTYSEDQTQWTSQNQTTVTANSTTAPNGTITADTVTPSTANDDHYRGIILSQQIGVLTAFIYVKPNGYNFFDWGIYNGSQYIVRATFDLVNLTYTFTNAGTATIESVGNGWLKCGISGTNASLTTVSLYYRSRPTGGSGNYAGDGTSGAFVWGAQLVEGSTAKPYFPTTDRLNVPRLDYSNGCPSLLLEPQRTNLITYSEDITNSFATKFQVTITSNNTTSPDGTQNADLLKFDSSTAYILRNQTVNALTAYTMSVFVKNNNFTSGQILTFNMSDGVIGGLTAQINVVAKTATFSGASGAFTSVSGKVEDYGNGWFRVSVTGTSVGGGSGWYEMAAAGVTNSCFVWGFSLEEGTYPTSYIPTTSASVTRVADAASKTGISSLIGQSEGTMFVDVDLTHFNFTAGNEYLMQLFEAAGERLILYRTSSNELSCYYLQGVTTFFKVSTITTNGRHKLAFAYKSGDSAFYIDGVQIDINTTTFSAFSSLNELHIGANFNPTQAEIGAYNYNQATVFPTRLTNAELTALTTL